MNTVLKNKRNYSTETMIVSRFVCTFIKIQIQINIENKKKNVKVSPKSSIQYKTITLVTFMTMLTNNRNLSLFEVLVIYFYQADMNLENENVVKLSTQF